MVDRVLGPISCSELLTSYALVKLNALCFFWNCQGRNGQLQQSWLVVTGGAVLAAKAKRFSSRSHECMPDSTSTVGADAGLATAHCITAHCIAAGHTAALNRLTLRWA